MGSCASRAGQRAYTMALWALKVSPLQVMVMSEYLSDVKIL